MNARHYPAFYHQERLQNEQSRRCRFPAWIAGMLLLLRLYQPGYLMAQSRSTDRDPSDSNQQFQICNLQTGVPGARGSQIRILQIESDLLLFEESFSEAGNKFSVQWLVTCHRNVNYTSRLDQILESAGQPGRSISKVQQITIPFGLAGIRYQQITVKRGRKLITNRIYFASRQYEYYIHVIPVHPAELPAARLLLQSAAIDSRLQTFVQELHFQQPPQATITEQSYQRRLQVLIAIGIGMVIASVLLIWLAYKRKQRVRRPTGDSHDQNSSP
ncbi:MAG: hypothetical protein KDK39_14685 [Leptospiraceae bacterium]|nr:hypothetical protein [Leptospiraceae bacterium]